MIKTNLAVLSVICVLMISCISTTAQGDGGDDLSLEIDHTPIEIMEVGRIKDITIDIHNYEVTSVYVNWIDVDGEEFTNRSMDRDPVNNETWSYVIPAQLNQGVVEYFFTIWILADDSWHRYPEQETYTISIEYEEDSWPGHRYILAAGAVVLMVLVIFEAIRRKVPSGYKKDYRKQEETEEDKWRKL